MPGNIIKSRQSIHDSTTPQREDSGGSDDDSGDEFENFDRFINTAESGEERLQITGVYIKRKIQIQRKKSKPRDSALRNVPAVSITSNKAASGKGFPYIVLLFFLTLAMVVIALLYHQGERSCSFENLQSEYASESDTVWLQLQFGIEIILNKKIDKPAVYLLAHKNTENSLSLIEKIAQQSSECFGIYFKRLIRLGCKVPISLFGNAFRQKAAKNGK